LAGGLGGGLLGGLDVPPDGFGGGFFEPPVFGSATTFGLPVILSMIIFVPAPITAPVIASTTLFVVEPVLVFGLLTTGFTTDVGVVVLVVGAFGLVVIVGLVVVFVVIDVVGVFGVVGVVGVCVVGVLGVVLDVSVVLGT
jgi:hypothetical protein